MDRDERRIVAPARCQCMATASVLVILVVPCCVLLVLALTVSDMVTWWRLRICGPVKTCRLALGLVSVPLILANLVLLLLVIMTVRSVVARLLFTVSVIRFLAMGRLRTVCVRSVNLSSSRETSAITFALRGWGEILPNRTDLLASMNSLMLNMFYLALFDVAVPLISFRIVA